MFFAGASSQLIAHLLVMGFLTGYLLSGNNLSEKDALIIPFGITVNTEHLTVILETVNIIEADENFDEEPDRACYAAISEALRYPPHISAEPHGSLFSANSMRAPPYDLV